MSPKIKYNSQNSILSLKSCSLKENKRTVGGLGWDAKCTGSNGQSNDYMTKKYGGCCVYQPKIQVKDNWGWCNGTCKGEPGGDGCYDEAGGKLECKNFVDTTANTIFKFKVLVAPSKIDTNIQL